MAKFACKVCGEQYPDKHGNGEMYFHRCPPIDTGLVLAMSRAERIAIDPALADAVTPDQIQYVLSRSFHPRPNERNENIDPLFRHAPRIAGDLSPFPDPPRIQPFPPPDVIEP